MFIGTFFLLVFGLKKGYFFLKAGTLPLSGRTTGGGTFFVTSLTKTNKLSTVFRLIPNPGSSRKTGPDKVNLNPDPDPWYAVDANSNIEIIYRAFYLLVYFIWIHENRVESDFSR